MNTVQENKLHGNNSIFQENTVQKSHSMWPQSKSGTGIQTLRNQTIDLTINYKIFNSKIGKLLIAGTDKGICSLNIGSDGGLLFSSLQKEFPKATLIESDGLQPAIDAIIHYLDGGQLDIPVDIYGTEFQVKVWAAIKAIPYGATKSYSELAEEIGMPTAYRAVANACGANPVPLIIPCHRVVGKNGHLGGYGPGVDKKKFLLDLEKINKNKDMRN